MRHCALLFLLLLVPLLFSGQGLPSSRWSLTHYTINLKIDCTDGAFHGKETVSLANTSGKELGTVYFRLYPNSPYLYGSGTLHVDAVRAQGTTLAATTVGDGTVLPIYLPSPLSPQSRTTIAISFTGELSQWHNNSPPSSSDYGIYAANKHTLTMASFYPILAAYDPEIGWDLTPVGPIGDPVTSDIADYDVTVTVPTGVKVVASGTQVGGKRTKDETQHRFVGNAMRDFMLVAGDNFAVQTTNSAGIMLRADFSPGHRRAATTALAQGEQAVALYSARFGPCAYPKVDLVEVPLARAAGVEYPGLVLIGSHYCATPSTEFFSIIVAHELAHQWWYAAVGNDVSAEPWLDEALATYSSVIYLENTAGPAIARAVLAEFQEDYHAAHAAHPELAVASPTNQFPDNATYSAIVYSGGACFLDAIRQAIGDTAFFSALSTYYHAFTFRRAIGDDLLATFVRACRCNLGKIYSEYLHPAAVTSP